MQRAARFLSVTLITAGLVILLDVGLTLIWKEPLSATYGTIQQGRAGDELDGVTEEFGGLPGVERARAAAGSARETRRLADLYARVIEDGKAIGRIAIPAIDADYVVVEGTGTAALRKGPGHYPDTGLPGQGRTIAIAGHRTTYLAPFNRIDDLERGDRISLEMPYGTFDYEVTQTRVVEPTQTEIVDDVGRERLVLTSCHPLYSAAQRYVVFADLEDFEVGPPGD